MSGSKHTPGPWHVSEPDDPLAVLAGDGHEVTALCVDDDEDEEEVEANARLIAAAPGMYAAIRGILAAANPGEAVGVVPWRVREAIEAARAALPEDC